MTRRTRTVLKGAAMLLGLALLCAFVWIRSGRVGGTRAGLGRSFDFDMQRHLKVDPALVKYRQSDAIHSGVNEPTALAVSEGRIYVGGSGGIGICVTGLDGAEQLRIKVDDVKSLCVGADGKIYAGVGNHIEVFSEAGELEAKWEASSANAIPASIVIRGEDVLVGDARKGEVQRYDRGGVLLDSIPGFVLFSTPRIGMAVDAEQHLWAANSGARELRRYKPDGSLVASWQKSGRDIESFSGCCNPADIALLPDGNIVTSEKNIVRVKVVTTAGELVSVVAPPSEFDQSITDLDIDTDANGNVYVLDPVLNAVRVFVPLEKVGDE